MATSSPLPAEVTQSKPRDDSGNSVLLKSPELVILLSNIKNCLAKDDIKQALHLLVRCKIVSPWVSNAIGVCQLRQNNSAKALDSFRDIVLTRSGIILRSDIPVVFKTNYATALLMSGNVSGCRSVLSELRESHPAASRLLEAIRRLTKSLTRWQLLCWYLGFEPTAAVTLDFPPGDLD